MRIRWQGFTSLLVAITFLAMGFSGVILYLTPKGRVAHWTGWTMLGLGKEEWAGVHMNFALLFLIAAGFHWFFNWNMFWGYIKKKKARRPNFVTEMAIAAVIAVFCLAGTVYLVPPLSMVVDGREQMETYWEVRSPRPPAPHAEEFKLKRFANAIGLEFDVVKKTLEEEGYTVPNRHITVRQLAEQKEGGVPSDVLAAVQRHYPSAGTKPPGCLGGKGGCNAPDKSSQTPNKPSKDSDKSPNDPDKLPKDSDKSLKEPGKTKK